MKNLDKMDEPPKYLDKRIFSLIFAIGEIGKLTKEEQMSYEASLKQRRDAASVYDSARRAGISQGYSEGFSEGIEKGIEQGIEKEKISQALKMLKAGSDIEYIADITGLTVEQIKKLK